VLKPINSRASVIDALKQTGEQGIPAIYNKFLSHMQ